MMKTPTFRTTLRLLGILLQPFVAFLVLLGFKTKGEGLGARFLFLALSLALVSVYFLFGAPQLVRALGHHDSHDHERHIS